MRPAYTVAWPRRPVERTVAEFVVRAMQDGTGSATVTAALAEIDGWLSTRPDEVGESRDGGERIVFAPPLGVTYRVREAERVVEALRAIYRPRHSAD